MVNFVDSFNVGLDAAKRAESNREIVSDVFNKMNEELSKHTDGKIQIFIAKYEDRPEGPLAFSVLGFNKKYYYAISAKNPTLEDGETRELARWEQDRAGFPCTIELYEKRFYCEDRESLEEALGQLLEDPTIGDALYNLFRMGNTDS